MANAALAAWGVKFLQTLGALRSNYRIANNHGNENSRIAFKENREIKSGIVTLRTQLIQILTSSSLDPGQVGAILSALDNIIKGLIAASPPLQQGPFIDQLQQWYDKFIKPLI